MNPPPETARNLPEVTCQRVQRGRTMTCPNPPISQALQAAVPALTGLGEEAIKEHPLKGLQVRKQASVG